MSMGQDLKDKAESGPITFDPNVEDLATVEIEIKLAERLGAKLNRKFIKIPTGAYGVEWASFDKKSGKLSGFVHFVHSKAGVDGFTVRFSRVIRGLQVAAAAGVPFTVIVMRGKDTGFAKLSEGDLEGAILYSGRVGDTLDIIAEFTEDKITRMK